MRRGRKMPRPELDEVAQCLSAPLQVQYECDEGGALGIRFGGRSLGDHCSGTLPPIKLSPSGVRIAVCDPGGIDNVGTE